MPGAGPRPCVVIHTNDQQMIAARVGAHSLKSRSRHPDLFDIRFLRLEQTPYLDRRNGQKFIWWTGDQPSVWRRRDLQSFAPLRRLVPALLNFEGRALVLDPDVFAIGPDLVSWERLSRAIRRVFGGEAKARVFFRPHPDRRQEKLFFTLLKECVEQGSITTAMLRTAIRKNYLRKDAFALLGL